MLQDAGGISVFIVPKSAMGVTDEMAIGHYFKRATMIEGLFGSTDHHLARYEALSLGAAA